MNLQYDGISKMKLQEQSIVINGTSFLYDEIIATRFAASVTDHRVNGVKTGKSYNCRLSIRTLKDQEIHVKPDFSLFGLKKDTFDNMGRLAYALNRLTFNRRLNAYEQQIAEKGYFIYEGFAIHRRGKVTKNHMVVADFRDNTTRSLISYDCIVFEPDRTKLQKALAAVHNNDFVLEILWNRDCLLYMLKHYVGITWAKEAVEEKLVDRQRIYYEAVLKVGAQMAAADGEATSEELLQLKKYFVGIEDALQDASRIYNEQLLRPASITDCLSDFIGAFDDAPEVRESFFLGMITVSLADRNIDRGEFRLLMDIASVLRLQKPSVMRCFRHVGLDFERLVEFFKTGTSSQNTIHDSVAADLGLLGLAPPLDKERAKSAYRSLVKRYHPDILRGKGLPESEISRATAILKEINLAYERLTRST